MRRESAYGMYRAKVVDNKDPLKYGRVLVWIPDIMPNVEDTKGIWARPANNPIGGRNIEGDSEHHYMGTSYIPRKGAWVFLFFEGGNINKPYYFGALDIENTQVLPENRVGSNYEDKWTIFKSHDGRTVIVSDDPSDARVEITGKKSQLDSPPSGNTESVYQIDGNQTTILFDERKGKEKILIRTRKGDFFHVDIDEQKLQAFFKSDIIIKTEGKFQLNVKDDIDIVSLVGDMKIDVDQGNLEVQVGSDFKETVGSSKHSSALVNHNTEARKNINHKAGTFINDDAGSCINEQSGKAKTAEYANPAERADPKGSRST